MIAAVCFALLLSASPAPPPAFHVSILIQFDTDALAGLSGWDGTANGLVAQIAKTVQLPDGAQLQESALTRLERSKGAPTDFSRWMILTVPASPGAWPAFDALVQRLSALPYIAHAELDRDAAGWKIEPRAVAARKQEGVIPNDPFFSQQYYLQQIRAPQAWELTTGAPFITVAVLDAGFDTYLADLEGRLTSGYDYVADTPDLRPESRHGIAMAALIAAAGDDCEGIAGVDWQCRVLPVTMTTGGVAVWAEALEYAIRRKVDVINISGKLELGGPSPILEGLLKRAHDAGIVIVASAGNQDLPQMAWPASSQYVIAVGATDGFDARWRRPTGHGSNYGTKLDLVAPGESIVTLDRSGHSVKVEGTSAAAALVSGTCSLMLSANPSLTPEEIRTLLRTSAEKIGPKSAWRDGASSEFGAGRLNAYAAVAAARDAAQLAPRATRELAR